MTITLNGFKIFCTNCASFDLGFVEDELLQEMSESESIQILKCGRCGSFFSKEFVETNFDAFTDESTRQTIIEKRMAFRKRYDNLEEANTEKEVPKSRRKKRTITEGGGLAGYAKADNSG